MKLKRWSYGASLAAALWPWASLAADVVYERKLRSSVMESLPLAISVYAGDPPRVVDWNRRERTMLGILDDSERPSDMVAGQQKFDIRFADGTPWILTTLRSPRPSVLAVRVVRPSSGYGGRTGPRSPCACTAPRSSMIWAKWRGRS